MGSSENKTHTHTNSHILMHGLQTDTYTNRQMKTFYVSEGKFKEISQKEGQSFALTLGALVGKCEWRNGASLGKLWAWTVLGLLKSVVRRAPFFDSFSLLCFFFFFKSILPSAAPTCTNPGSLWLGKRWKKNPRQHSPEWRVKRAGNFKCRSRKIIVARNTEHWWLFWLF